MVDDLHWVLAGAKEVRDKADRCERNLKQQHPAQERFPAYLRHFNDKQRQGDHDEIVDEVVDDQVRVLPKALRSCYQRMQKALPEDQPDRIEKRKQAEVHQAAVGRLSLEEEEPQAGHAKRENHHSNRKARELPAQIGDRWPVQCSGW